jgi:hypothetical protein
LEETAASQEYHLPNCTCIWTKGYQEEIEYTVHLAITTIGKRRMAISSTPASIKVVPLTAVESQAFLLQVKLKARNIRVSQRFVIQRIQTPS